METFSALQAFCAGNSPVNSPHKGQWRRALMFLWSAPSINAWVNNREAGDLRHHRAHYDVIVMGLRGLHKWFYCLPYRPNSAPLMAISVFPFPLIRPQAGTCILWCLVLSFLDTDMVQVDEILPHKAYTCFLSPYHDGCWLAVTISHCISSLSIDWNIPVSAPESFIIEKFLVHCICTNVLFLLHTSPLMQQSSHRYPFFWYQLNAGWIFHKDILYFCFRLSERLHSSKKRSDHFTIDAKHEVSVSYYPWASYQIHKIAGYTCAGNARNVFPTPASKETAC